MVGKSWVAALGFVGMFMAGTAGGSAPASAYGCGPWNNWCAPACGPWNNWCRPVCGPWNGWCAYFVRPGYGYGYGGKDHWGGHGGGSYAYRHGGNGHWNGHHGGNGNYHGDRID